MRLYFMSICGTGMGNAALLMKQLGHEVIGCDQNIFPPMSDRLAEADISILEGFDPERLAKLGPDKVIVGNVNTRGNPEIEWLLRERDFPMISMPELLADELLTQRKNIVVTGTHGKTTTTSMTAKLLQSVDPKSGYLIGGICEDFTESSQAGEPTHPFVIEGDEYDSAFFDKRSKFIHYRPNIVIANNLEFDHADIFRDRQDIERTFQHLFKLIPDNGTLLINGDDEGLSRVAEGVTWSKILKVGIGSHCDVCIDKITSTSEGTSFTLNWDGQPWSEVELPLWGEFNVRNAAMAMVAASLALTDSDSSPSPIDSSPLASFKGVKRRQECLWSEGSLQVFTDFAHHPTAVRETLTAFRQRFPQHRLIACFEARSNTACRKIHQKEFTEAFRLADSVYFGEVFRAERYDPSDRIDFVHMANELGPQAKAFAHNSELPKALLSELNSEASTIVVFLSNGSFDRVPQRSVELLKKNSSLA